MGNGDAKQADTKPSSPPLTAASAPASYSGAPVTPPGSPERKAVATPPSPKLPSPLAYAAQRIDHPGSSTLSARRSIFAVPPPETDTDHRLEASDFVFWWLLTRGKDKNAEPGRDFLRLAGQPRYPLVYRLLQALSRNDQRNLIEEQIMQAISPYFPPNASNRARVDGAIATVLGENLGRVNLDSSSAGDMYVLSSLAKHGSAEAGDRLRACVQRTPQQFSLFARFANTALPTSGLFQPLAHLRIFEAHIAQLIYENPDEALKLLQAYPSYRRTAFENHPVVKAFYAFCMSLAQAERNPSAYWLNRTLGEFESLLQRLLQWARKTQAQKADAYLPSRSGPGGRGSGNLHLNCS